MTRTLTAPRRHVSILIVGSGFGGVAAAIALRRKGFDAITIVERAAEVGGTWNANRYPGIAVDTSILNYSLSYDANPGWSRLYAPGVELRAYINRLVDRHDLRRLIRFNTTVTEMRFDQVLSRWEVATADGPTLTADVVISATGVLSTPSIPAIAGLQDFKGTVLHSGAWDESFDAAGRRVAQIGSGATAAQLVPEIAKTADQVFVFQRSAPWVLPRNDRTIGTGEAALYRLAPWLLKARRWYRFWRNDIVAYGFEKQNRVVEQQTRAAMRFIESSISDPHLRRAVTPDYEIGCKRRVMSDDWYPALQRENVELISTALGHVTNNGVVGADGVEREVDTIIFSTGFAVTQLVPMKVFGLDGKELHTHWAQGAKTHLGISVAGFPNFFLIGGPNTGIGSGSMTFMLESAAHYITRAVTHLASSDAGSMDLLEVVQDRTYREIQQRLSTSVFGSGCVGWYQNPNGTIDTIWPGLNAEYWWRTRRFNAADYLFGSPAATAQNSPTDTTAGARA